MAALVHAPAFGRVGFGLLKRHELGHVDVIQRIGLAHVASGGEQVEPNLASLRALVKEDHDRLAPAKKRVAGAIERGVVVAFFGKLLTQADAGVVGATEGLLKHGCWSPSQFIRSEVPWSRFHEPESPAASQRIRSDLIPSW